MKSSLQDTQQPYAVVIGLDDGLNGIQTARILARREIPVIAIASNPQHHCSRTRVCEKIIFTNTNSEELIETLEYLGPKLNHKAVLFPCQDTNVLLISRHRRRLEPWYYIVLPAHEVVEMMMDKISFYSFAQREGFPIPQTFILHKRADAEQAGQELNFPAILKPSIRSPAWMQNIFAKAFRVANSEKLLTIYDHHKKWADAFIVQDWIAGPDMNHYSCNCYLDVDSQPIVTFATRKLRQWPPQTGQGCLGQECRNDVVVKETVRLFQSVNYRGLGYLEMKCDARSGKYLIIEPNIGRPTGRSATAEAGGVELLYTMYCDAIGRPLPANRQQKYGGVKWIYLRQDLQSALHEWRQGNLSSMEWWRSFRGRKTYALFSWQDPAPFLGDLTRMARVLLSQEERRKRNYQNQIV